MRIVLDGLVLGDGDNPTTDDIGATWLTTSIEGWDAMPSRLGMMDYSMRHGGVTANPTYGPRAITLSGVCKVPNEAVFWQAYNRMLGLVGLSPKTLTITEDVDKSVTVVRGTEPRLRIKPAHFEWQIGLTAPDPLKYGSGLSTSIAAGSWASLTNAGNAESFFSRVTLTGTGNVTLRHGGTNARMIGRSPMSGGTVIDQRARTVYYNDENRHFQLSPVSQWWGLLPGTNSIFNDGNAPVSIFYRPAWV